MEREELEKMTRDYQNIQMQIQSLSMQKMQFSQQKEEYKDAEKELSLAKGKVYIDIGGLMIETTKDEALIKLKEKMESVEMRFKIITRQHEEASKKEQALRSTLTEELKKSQ